MGLTSPPRKTKKKVPLPLKRVRIEVAPPGRIFESKTKYNRKRVKAELEQKLREISKESDRP
jgi:hypothetical protein